jgi:hypothetical protein
MQLAKNVEVRYVGAAVAAASSTDSNSTIIDMAGWDGVIFVTTVTASTATSVVTLKAEQNTANSDSGMAALSGASASATSAVTDDLNGKTLIVSVHQPRKRYVQAVRTSATANSAFGQVIAILYGPRTAPTAAASTTAASADTVSPAEA